MGWLKTKTKNHGIIHIMEYHAINRENEEGLSVLTWKDVSSPTPTPLQADGCEAAARWKADNGL